MEKQGKVSVWVGKFDSQEQLNEYIEEIFDEEGDSTSQFMSDFNIDYIDPQFQEVDFNGQNIPLKEQLEGFSYVDSFIDKLTNINLNYNSIIMLYNFSYENSIESAKSVKYIGCFDYAEN